jgi:hypothetical protein
MMSGIESFRRGLGYATLATLAFAGMAAWGTPPINQEVSS